jgi:hypothetical protein
MTSPENNETPEYTIKEYKKISITNFLRAHRDTTLRVTHHKERQIITSCGNQFALVPLCDLHKLDALDAFEEKLSIAKLF